MDAQALNLLNGQSSSSADSMTSIGSSIGSIFAYITIGSIVITVVVVVFWVVGYLHRRKMQQAIIEIRDVLMAMNEREKLRTMPAKPVVVPEAPVLQADLEPKQDSQPTLKQ